ncbi:MAG TPA: carboxypeptidase-like regulatory domain-containing protein [Candidatus Udaeobacter sp.]|nr:carboxypeptidase-like regulatory domain-containing protein [Candidatus Udaeobacter sp.]
MKQARLRSSGALILTVMLSSFAANPAAAQAKRAPGKIAGVVSDAAGIPQLGASVELISEAAGLPATLGFVTNTQGVFHGEKLAPGFYTARVTLAGFLPTLEKHIRVTSNLTTVVRIELASMFASLDQLRRTPSNSAVESDDWKWVLRSASATRPVLEWMEAGGSSAPTLTMEAGSPPAPRFRMELTDGARRPVSASNIAASPATAVAYDQKLGGTSRVILAAQVNYDQDAPAGGISTVWLPTGTIGAGPHTALVLRQAKLGPTGQTFRGVRLDQGGALALSDRMALRYGAEYALVGLGTAASSLRPRAELNVRVSDAWQADMIFASMPTGPAPLESADGQPGGALAAALNELDAFPTLLWRSGKPVLENGWHEELTLERKAGTRGKLEFAGFHDDNRHVAVFGRGNGLPVADYFQDYLTSGFAYDGGSSSSWGTRIAFRQQLDDDVELTAIYSFGGALTPFLDSDDLLRDVLHTVPRHSVGAGITAKVPRFRTKVRASYKWVNGVTVSRVDGYGESLFQMDPYFHLGLRQPLPKFALGRWEAIADCDNLLAQGYVSAISKDGRVVLMPSFRTFRGGLSFQF